MANVITCIRIACGFGLVFCPAFSQWFYVLYIIGGISDVLDGLVARLLKTQSKLGAKLDTVADFIFIVVLFIKVFSVTSIPLWLIIWIICIAVIKFINVISGIVISKRLVFEHTVLNKICGILLFIIPFCIDNFSRQAVTVLIILTCIIATFASLQEGRYIRTGKEVN